MQSAIVLLGPTGSGKSPLGDQLEQRGMGGRPCVHFDFGAHLREVVARGVPDEIVSQGDIDFLREVLRTGALLSDDDMAVAQRVLTAFLRRRQVGPGTLTVLNGLPRHVGQARALAETFDVRQVLLLDCSPAVAYARIAANTGGDRSLRTDDEAADVERRLATYVRQTAPLVEFYEERGARVTRIGVTATTTAEQMYAELLRQST